MEQQPKVSIYILAYNHENYIRDMIDGILMQQTDFAFEAIIHDDASTDHTAAIISEYAAKYPQIIKPILQEHNQKSQGIDIFFAHFLPRARGEYIATCEGDDYWTDPHKLQKQVDYMDAHPDCSFCFTNGMIVDQSGKAEPRVFLPFNAEDAAYYHDESRIYTLDDTYQLTFIPAASFFYRRAAVDQLPETYRKACPNGDLKERLFLTSLGYSYYMKDITCVYRQNVPNSAMTKWKTDSREKAFARCETVISMIDDLNAFTNYEHTDGLYRIQIKHLLSALRNVPSVAVLRKCLMQDKYRKAFRSLSAFGKLKVIGKSLLPESLLAWMRHKRGA